MHNDHEFVEARLDRFVRDRLTRALYRDARPLQASAWVAPGRRSGFA
jgi:alpha-mannosidase